MAKQQNRNAEALRTCALGYPEAREDFPWGERVVKVRDKVFVFLGRDDEDMGVTASAADQGATDGAGFGSALRRRTFISTRERGRSPSTGVSLIVSTTSMPETTTPNSVYWPFRDG